MNRESTITRRREFLRARGNKHHDCTHIATLWLAYRREQEQLVMDVQEVFEDFPGAELSAEGVAEMICVSTSGAAWAYVVWAILQCEEFGVAVRSTCLPNGQQLWKCAHA